MDNVLNEFYGNIVIKKCNSQASLFRDKGNEQYRSKEYLDALISYNESLSYSETYENLSFANRAAVYYEIGLYDECLKNIEWARKNKYPKAKISKLNEREEKCKKIINEKAKKNERAEDYWEFFKLSYPANKKIPWIVDCLEMRETKKYGRGIYSKKDLKIGDIICIEEPPVSMIHIMARYTHCINCYNTCMLNLIPSTQSASVMFCSSGCMKEFSSKILDKETFLNEDVRLLTEIVHGFDGISKFNDFANRTNLKTLNKTIFDYDFSNKNDPEYKKNISMCLLSLQSVRDDNSGNTKYTRNFVSKDTADHVSGMVNVNRHYCSNVTPKGKYPGRRYISLFVSLLNHSCAHNAIVLTANNKIIVMVIKPIKAGEQIFKNYLGNIQASQGDKSEVFTKIYKFICKCPECSDPNYKYPVIIALPVEFMDRKKKCMDVAREHLMEGWRISNTLSCKDSMFNISRSIAYAVVMNLCNFCTFPC